MQILAKLRSWLRSGRAVGVICIGITIAALFLFEEGSVRGPRLIGYEAEPEECTDSVIAQQLPNWSGELPLRLAFQQQRAAEDAAYKGQNLIDFSQRQPERVIRDPYASYSAVAVDVARNEVVLTDENRFNILIYDRNTNTGPNSESDPKRIIGGLNTKIEFQCGLYIDPKSGDIYAVNNDTVDSLVIFSRQAIGNVKPDRELHT